MKDRYDFSKGTRGPIIEPTPEPAGKTRITIRIDEDIIDYFLAKAEASGGETGYQTIINEALRSYMDGNAPKIEETLRRIIREELKAGQAA